MEIADIATVVAQEKEIFDDSLGFDMFYQELTINPYANYFILEINGDIAGYIGTWIYEDKAEIINFYVVTRFQNMGFGTMLLDFAMELFVMSKISTVSLEVRVSNERAIAIYEQYGFKKSHIREKYYKNYEDAIVMILELEENE